jgi:N-acetyl-gamma-glutamyl-phosphate reductase
LHLEKHDDQLLITSVIDNLTKGAAGQAVQNMNLLFGLDEETGLKLKSVGF